jgi:hypothetical protein
VRHLVDRFTTPPAASGPLPIWWWSGDRLTRERLRWQMERMVEGGVRQAVVMCLAPTGPLFGCLADEPPFQSPAWWELLAAACADAQDLGFTLWLYDQIGFSGANIQGRLVAARPEFAGMVLHPTGPTPGGFDYFSPEACAALIDTVHGEYERRVGAWFGTSIGGFFQDELPAMPTWGRDFAASFAADHGYDPVPWRWALWEPSTDPDAVRFRRDYHAHRAALAKRAFFDPLADWLDRYGLVCGFDQPTPAREGDPVGGVKVYGDYLGTHARYGAPGSDHWGDAKVHSSLAHAKGHGRTWIEAFHSSGWGGTLEETCDWLAPFLRRGATLYDPHAVYYSTAGGWWEWAAPSTCWRQPYWPSYDVFATAVARLCAVLTEGHHVCDTVLLSPTGTAQGYLTLAGPLPPAQEAAAAYHALNGVNAWPAQRPGVLERHGHDHDVLDEASVASGRIVDGALVVGSEAYRNVVLPRVASLARETAARLAELVAAGGTVVSVGPSPVGEVVSSVDDVPALLQRGPVWVESSAPYLLRRVGDAYVLLLTASGTEQPILEWPSDNWASEGFPWDWYWASLRTRGYRFTPTGERRARVTVHGLEGYEAQRWDPRTGRRYPVALSDVPFDGPMALLVLAPSLPAPSAPADPVAAAGLPARAASPAGPPEVLDLAGPWRARAESTLDNRWGDLAATSVTGTVPVQVWRLSTEDGPVTATYGPFASVRGPGDTEWRPAVWSLSRGIAKDPIHLDALGPKGYVPEEFLDWRAVKAGEWVAVRTHLDLPGGYLAVGANAHRSVFVDGAPAPVEGDGYLTFTPVGRGPSTVEIRLRSDVDGPVRASFAVVRDPTRYRRPEWLRGSAITRRFTATGPAVIQVASDGPCAILVNGVEVGRQGDFQPYPGHREVRVHPYDIGPFLEPGENELTLLLGDDTAALVDSMPGGPGLVSGPEWTGGTLQRRHPRDPRFACAWPRPHPLPRAGWLGGDADPSGTVELVVPDVAPGPPREESLRLAAPLGTTALTVHSGLSWHAEVDGRARIPVRGKVSFPAPLPAGTPIVLRFSATDGRRGGALLSGPVEVDTAETETSLLDWTDLGLANLGGLVRYRTSVSLPAAPDGRAVLDLGAVRGTADVLVNGTLADRLVWSPWRADVTGLLAAGDNQIEVVVRGTLAGYLEDASPTPAVTAGQTRAGLYGPVRLILNGAPR